MRFTSLIIKNLTRRPFRTALTLLAFATAISAVVALLGIANGFTKSFADVYESHSVDIVVSRQGTADRLSSSVDQAFAEQDRRDPWRGTNRGRVAGDDCRWKTTRSTVSRPWESRWLLVVGRLQNSIGKSRQRRVAKQPAKLDAGRALGRARGRQCGRHGDDVRGPLFGDRCLRESQHLGKRFDDHAAASLQELTDRTGQVTYINVVLDKPVDASASRSSC